MTFSSLVLTGLVALGACTGTSSPVPRVAACTQPLSASSCAPTLAEQMATANVCQVKPCCALVGACGNYRVWQTLPDLGSTTCIYDGSGGQLLAATNCTDYPAYCNNTESCISAGATINIAAACNVTALPNTCPQDGGAD